MIVVDKAARSERCVEMLKSIFQAKVIERKPLVSQGPGRDSSPEMDKIKEILGVKNLTKR